MTDGLFNGTSFRFRANVGRDMEQIGYRRKNSAGVTRNVRTRIASGHFISEESGLGSETFFYWSNHFDQHRNPFNGGRKR